MVFSFVDIFHYVLFNWVAYRELRIHNQGCFDRLLGRYKPKRYRHPIDSSTLHTLMEITKCPPLRRKVWAFRATIRVWSGWATSAKITSTIAREKEVAVKS